MREWNKIICYENLAARRRMLQSNLMQKAESLRKRNVYRVSVAPGKN
jgi:hypothetical protein